MDNNLLSVDDVIAMVIAENRATGRPDDSCLMLRSVLKLLEVIPAFKQLSLAACGDVVRAAIARRKE